MKSALSLAIRIIIASKVYSFELFSKLLKLTNLLMMMRKNICGALKSWDIKSNPEPRKSQQQFLILPNLLMIEI